MERYISCCVTKRELCTLMINDNRSMTKCVGIGIDIGGTSIKFGLVDLDGKGLWESKVPTMAKTSKDQVLDNVFAAGSEAMAAAQNLGVRVAAIGVGTPGLVSKAGTVIGGVDNIVDWKNVPLAKLLTDYFGQKVYVANDADLMAIGELGCLDESVETVLFFTLGTGIGGAIIIKRKLFQGHYGLGGELGVFPMMLNGTILNWEDVASTAALVRLFKQSYKGNDEVNGKYIIQKFKEGDSLARKVVKDWTRYVGMGIGGYVNIFNPQKIIIGGGVSDAGEAFIDLIYASVREFSIEESRASRLLSLAQLGNSAGYIGAGIYAMNRAGNRD